MQKLVVLGGGESGVGTAILAKKKGFKVFVSDYGLIKEKYRNVLIQNDIDWEDGGHTESLILDADVIMKSPGIPEKAPLVKHIREKGIKVVSEIEFAAGYTNATLIGITGSNGKTTTTLLTYHLLKSAGLNVGLAGNIGDSFAMKVANETHDVYVLEISSFQLDDIFSFKPHISIITNITPDHLDRYNYKFENYIQAKFRITANQDVNDYLIYDADDEVITEWLNRNKVAARLLPFSITKTLEEGVYLENNELITTIDNLNFTMSTDNIKLEGKHNVKNAMAASTVAQLLKIRKQTIRDSFETFHGAEHRMEKVLKIQNVQYVNDSKATNINATFYALDSIATPIVWIVGGVDKGNDYGALMQMVREKVKAIICLGVDNSKIIDAYGSVAEVLVESTSMDEAVQMAYKFSEKGDTVLLSPACASFDLFQNYEDRGRQFKDAVRRL